MALLPLFLLTAVLPYIGHCASTDMGIVNGSVVKEYSRPYMVSVQKNGRHQCGGFLVSKNFVMTAAHCWELETKLTVVAGAHDLKKDKLALTRIEVKFYHIHPTYDNVTMLSDIMLLQLNKPIHTTKKIKWIALPNKKNEDVKAKRVCSIAGWGKQSDNSGLSDRLMEVDVTVMDSKVCRNFWKPFYINNMVCTNGNGGFLQGDSGGPLVCKDKAVGIVSFFRPTNKQNPPFPNVYTKISRYLSWINCILGQTA